MNVFGHVGLTLAVAYTAERLFRERVARRRSSDALETEAAAEGPSPRRGSALLSVDYRMVMVGSLLVDVVDKPLGLWLAPELVNGNTRSIGHSAIFAALFLAGSLAALRWGWDRRWLVLASASSGHLLLDEMWGQPETVLWPVLGWAFPEGAASFFDWSASNVRDVWEFYTNPGELVGFVAILLFATRVSRPQTFLRFLKSGAVA